MLVDSHCHLNFPEFKDDLPDVIRRAEQNGVKAMLTVNTKLSEARDLQKIADQYPQIYCTVGVHPHYAQDHNHAGVAAEIRTLAQHPKVIGLGETGVDYYYNKSDPELQIASFRRHIEISLDLDLPIIIHTRAADEDTLATLDEYPGVKGVFHCFSGTEKLAQGAMERGFYLSFSGILTFKNTDVLRTVASWYPADRLLVETDAPLLAPVPFRGQRNEPAYTRHTAELLAQIRGCSLAEIGHQTTQNFYRLFHKAITPCQTISQ